jgi:amino-acid N-acetyltransferase
MTQINQILTKKPTFKDLPAIYNFLEGLGLPITGISDHLENFFLAVDGEEIIGTVGLEVYDKIALLRSVGVKKSHQGQKIGDYLMVIIEELAKFMELDKIFLFTDTAEKWFERYGYSKIDSEDLDPLLKQSKEYRLCNDSVRMVKTLHLQGVTL